LFAATFALVFPAILFFRQNAAEYRALAILLSFVLTPFLGWLQEAGVVLASFGYHRDNGRL